ncbi:MAG: radical SAM family heme chaperone HemW [Alphaproteobacteria bacterium]|nr:radical SAM family heme chaperone HemW [Alphaproteobacteria bacterium]
MTVELRGNFGIYVHWPFCASKCPYCDFNSHVRHKEVDQFRYAAALIRELDYYAVRTSGSGRRLESIFFGGGTPSLMDPRVVSKILEAISCHWSIDENVEITLEANPTSSDSLRFAGYRSAGVNRLSLGVQSLRDATLRTLGRQHDAAEALRSMELARLVFPRLSFDLIYTHPDQGEDEWREELSLALSLAADHLSLYQLTIEPGTAFYSLERSGRLVMPLEERGRTLFDLTQDLCLAAGLPAYEISNHARPGSESRHNLIYWRYGDYIGVGAGAHGRFFEKSVRYAASAFRLPETWLSMVEKNGIGLEQDVPLSPAESGAEFLLMGLRLVEGIDLDRYRRLSGTNLNPERIASLEALGFITRHKDGRLAVTVEGRAVLNRLIVELID